MVTVYGLVCIATGHAYVGCTAGKVGKRMREHRCLLNQGKHAAIRLQQDWDRLKEVGFRMDVLETLPDECHVIEKRERELFWMRHFLAQGLLYNDNLTSFSPPKGAQKKAAAARIANGYSPSAETRAKMRASQLGKPKGHGAKISATKQRQKAMR